MVLERWIARHWIALCAGCVLTGMAVRTAYADRGYVAFGGEWAVIPAVFVAEWVARAAYREMRRRCGITGI